MPKKFLRRDTARYSKLGKGKKKKQIWRRPTGRDNKMREKRKGYPAVVSVGYKKQHRVQPFSVFTIKDLEEAKGKEMIILGNIGKKKKIEIASKAKELKIKFSNFNPDKFLKQIKKEQEKKESKKKEESKDKKSKKEAKKKEAPKTEEAKTETPKEKSKEEKKPDTKPKITELKAEAKPKEEKKWT